MSAGFWFGAEKPMVPGWQCGISVYRVIHRFSIVIYGLCSDNGTEMETTI